MGVCRVRMTDRTTYRGGTQWPCLWAAEPLGFAGIAPVLKTPFVHGMGASCCQRR